LLQKRTSIIPAFSGQIEAECRSKIEVLTVSFRQIAFKVTVPEININIKVVTKYIKKEVVFTLNKGISHGVDFGHVRQIDIIESKLLISI